jgi:hypothetical protein
MNTSNITTFPGSEGEPPEPDWRAIYSDNAASAVA